MFIQVRQSETSTDSEELNTNLWWLGCLSFTASSVKEKINMEPNMEICYYESETGAREESKQTTKACAALPTSTLKFDTYGVYCFLVYLRVPSQECLCSTSWSNSCSLRWAQNLVAQRDNLSHLRKNEHIFSFKGRSKNRNYVSKRVNID